MSPNPLLFGLSPSKLGDISADSADVALPARLIPTLPLGSVLLDSRAPESLPLLLGRIRPAVIFAVGNGACSRPLLVRVAHLSLGMLGPLLAWNFELRKLAVQKRRKEVVFRS